MLNNTSILAESVLHAYKSCGFNPNQPLLLACSGGSDSVVLFHLLFTQKIPFVVAHANFQLRGELSDADEDFVRKLCIEHNITFHCKRFETQSLVQNSKDSVQMLARNLRYNWFFELVNLHHYAAIATAHHANDNIETVLLNMIRGTGLSGLAGMKEYAHKLFRPLLKHSKDEILKYAEVNHILWREDLSNQKTDYKRNQVRHHLIPEFEKINPAFVKTFTKNIRRWENEQRLAESLIHKYLQKFLLVKKEQIIMPINKLVHAISPETLLHYWLHPYGFSEDDLNNILSTLHQTHETKQFLSPDFRLIKTQRELILVNRQEKNLQTFLLQQGNGTFTNNNYKITFDTLANHPDINFTNTHYHYLNADKLTFPLVLRTYQKGDYFYPYGLNKKKKLSDYFQEKKLNLPERESVLVLTQSDKIICLIGFQIDHRFMVTRQTKKVLRIHVQKKFT